MTDMSIIKEKKIFFLISHLADGGAERVAANLSKIFPQNIQTVFVLFENSVEYSYNGRIVSFDLKPARGFFNKIINIIKRAVKLKKLINSEKPDAIVSFMESANLINIICNPRRAIVSVHIHPSTNYKNDFFSRSIIKLYNAAFKVICVSNGIKEDLASNYFVNKNKIEVIYNPIDDDEIKHKMSEPLEPEYDNIFKNNGVILTCGRLSAQKDHASLLKAFALARGHISDARLILLGRGELEEDLKRLTFELNISDKVFFAGFQRNPFKFIARSRLFVLSSIFEGLGNTLIEAMICGVPVISSDCPCGPAELFSGTPVNNLFAPRDIGAMASKIISFYKRNNADLFEFYKKRLESLSKEKIAAAYLKVCGC